MYNLNKYIFINKTLFKYLLLNVTNIRTNALPDQNIGYFIKQIIHSLYVSGKLNLSNNRSLAVRLVAMDQHSYHKRINTVNIWLVFLYFYVIHNNICTETSGQQRLT